MLREVRKLAQSYRDRFGTSGRFGEHTYMGMMYLLLIYLYSSIVAVLFLFSEIEFHYLVNACYVDLGLSR